MALQEHAEKLGATIKEATVTAIEKMMICLLLSKLMNKMIFLLKQ